MQMWNVFYGTICQPVYASNHEAARKLATKHLANTLGAIDPDKVAVVDPNVACNVPRYEPLTDGKRIPHPNVIEDAKVNAMLTTMYHGLNWGDLA